MKRAIAAAVAAATVMGLAPCANAGVYSDDLGKCLVRSTSSEDKYLLVQWIFSLMALNPHVKSLANVSDQQRDDLNRRTAGLYERLLLQDCRKETIDALRYDGSSAIENAFEVLGSASTKSLLNDSAVTDGLGSFTKYLDGSKLTALAKEIDAPKESSPSAPKN